MKTSSFTAIALCAALLVAGTTSALVTNDYFFSASYTVLQFVVLATAWNVLGGFTGYVNFGTAAFWGISRCGCAASSSPSPRWRSPKCSSPSW